MFTKCFALFLLSLAVIHAAKTSHFSDDDGSDGPSESSQLSSSHASSHQSSSSVNGGKPQVEKSESAVDVRQSCHNGVCKTCVNEKCFNGTVNYKGVKAVGGCPSAVCTADCSSFVVAKDGCPICKCQGGKGSREPCGSVSDCPKNSTGCEKNACMYGNIGSDLPEGCDRTSDCGETEDCVGGKCVKSASGTKHVADRSCTFDYMCPNQYKCEKGVCYEGGEEHLETRTCVFMNQCPSGYSCRDHTCYAGGPKHGENTCVFDTDCDDGMTCNSQQLTCVEK